jgi:two-component system, sensor histidine kinase and response regulator
MNKLAIICVDDDHTIRDSLEIELKKTVSDDYLVEMTETGQEALEVCQELLAQEHEIALVISDCIMPGMKGDELLKQIHILSPKTLSIMLTGQAQIEEISNAIKYSKLYRYIAKPWQSDDLRLTIKEALNSYLKEKKLLQFTQELQDKNAALLKLNQEKNELLGIVAHDLKNPLSTIQIGAEWLKNEYQYLSEEEVVETISTICSCTGQMFGFIKNLLDVNIIESGKLKVSLIKADVLPILQSIINRYKPFAKVKEIEILFEGLEKQYLAVVDERLVLQVLDNLISNAVKYSPHRKNIEIRINKDEKFIFCEIQDQGPGICQLEQQKLFQKFAHLSSEPTGGEHSTGLGLFIVKRLVNAMNGSVYCESELGKGSRFTVCFPITNSS